MFTRNLLEETLGILRRNGKTPADVHWVGCEHFWFTWDEFEELARNADYNCDYGSAEVAEDLMVVGDGWWLERNEYDGNEWWEFKQLPKKPEYHYIPKALTIHQAKEKREIEVIGWKSLAELNFGRIEKSLSGNYEFLELDENWLDELRRQSSE